MLQNKYAKPDLLVGEKAHTKQLVNTCAEAQVGESQTSGEKLIWGSHLGKFISFGDINTLHTFSKYLLSTYSVPKTDSDL